MNGNGARPQNRWEEFEAEVRRRENEIASLLPTHISRERFLNTAIIAAKNNPDLITCDRRSLHAAITKAAEDGLQPDGREGVINVYKEKRGDAWVKVASWIPMIYGIRKRAREICGMIIDAQIVCENDSFVWKQGDDPRIDHEPAKLGQPRGKMIGAYAIFKEGATILHREVMDEEQIARVKSCVKAQNGLLWTKFEDEAWRKTVLRRGIKTVPSVPDTLQRIVARDDDQYEFGRERQIELTAQKALPNVPDIPDIDAPDVAPEPPDAEPISEEAMVAQIEKRLEGCTSLKAVHEVEQEYATVLINMSSDGRELAISCIQETKASMQAEAAE